MVHVAAEDASVGKVVKGRFMALDAMRGIAAIIVVIFHSGELMGGVTPRFGYLAVDLFFILSGFVIARAYDGRLSTGMSFGHFAQLRLARLFPMLLIGAALGLLTPTTDAVITRLLSVALNSVALPGLPARTGAPLMPANPALWSLFFELWIANLSYGLLFRILRGPVLCAILLISAAGMAWIVHKTGWLNLGWGWGSANLPFGFVRVIWGFYAGVAISRLHQRFSPPKVPPAIIFFATAAVLCMPINGHLSHWAELALAVAVFPTLVYLGATMTERRPRHWVLLGETSYALYVIHHPLLHAVRPWLLAHGWNSLPHIERIGIRGAEVAFLFVVAAALATWVDTPAQRALRRLIARTDRSTTARRALSAGRPTLQSDSNLRD